MNFKDACKFAPVNFSGIDNSGTVTQWKWEFGDGGIAGTQNAQHTYNANGTYKVKLFVLAATGCFADTLKDDIIIYGTNAFAGKRHHCCCRPAVAVTCQRRFKLYLEPG